MLVDMLTVVRGVSGLSVPLHPLLTFADRRGSAARGPRLRLCAGTLAPSDRLCRATLWSPSPFLAATGGLPHQGRRSLFTEPYSRRQRTNTRDARCTQGATGSAPTRFRGQGLDGWDYGKCSSTAGAAPRGGLGPPEELQHRVMGS